MADLSYSEQLEGQINSKQTLTCESDVVFDSFRMEVETERGVDGSLILNEKELGGFDSEAVQIYGEETENLFLDGSNRLYILFRGVNEDASIPQPGLRIRIFGIKKSDFGEEAEKILEITRNTAEEDSHYVNLSYSFDLKRSE